MGDIQTKAGGLPTSLPGPHNALQPYPTPSPPSGRLQSDCMTYLSKAAPSSLSCHTILVYYFSTAHSLKASYLLIYLFILSHHRAKLEGQGDKADTWALIHCSVSSVPSPGTQQTPGTSRMDKIFATGIGFIASDPTSPSSHGIGPLSGCRRWKELRERAERALGSQVGRVSLAGRIRG